MGQNMDMTLKRTFAILCSPLAKMSIDLNAQQFQGFFWSK